MLNNLKSKKNPLFLHKTHIKICLDYNIPPYYMKITTIIVFILTKKKNHLYHKKNQDFLNSYQTSLFNIFHMRNKLIQDNSQKGEHCNFCQYQTCMI